MTTKAPVFLKYKGVTIYHTYHERYNDILNEYHYSTSPTRHARYQFDVRDLMEYGRTDPGAFNGASPNQAAIQKAIDNNTLPVPIPKTRAPRAISIRELNGILCGLRLVQRDGYLGEFGKVSALTDKQIDKLCEDLNTAKFIVLQ